MKKRSLLAYLRALLGRKKYTRKIERQLTADNIEALRVQLSELMDKKKPFLQNGYHMSDMATDLNMPAYQLSAFINQVIGMHFNEYLNKFRIMYCKGLIQSADSNRPNLKELAYRCGFNNRNSFTAAFKKYAGQRPSEYLKSINQSLCALIVLLENIACYVSCVSLASAVIS